MSANNAVSATALAELRAGWGRILSAAFGVGLGIAGLLTYNSGLFVAALGQDIGLTRTAYGAVFFGANVAMCVAMPLVARLVEARGPRLAAMLGAVALSIGFVLLSQAGSVPGYAAAMVFTGLFAAASAPVAHTRAIASDFHRARGLALGLTQLGIGLAAAMVPPLVTWIIAGHGWRTGFVLLAGLAALGLLPALGLPARVAGLPSSGQHGAASTFREVRGGMLFQVQIAAFTTMALAFAGMLSHFVPMLLDSGMPIHAAGRLAGLIGVSVIVTRVLVGWLSDRVEPAWLAVGSCLLCAAGCLTLALAGAQMATVGAIALGAAMGAEADLIAILTVRNIPLIAYSRAYAAQYAAFTVAAGLSPMWIGYLADRSGTYRSAEFMSALLLLVPAALFLWMALRKRSAVA
ncbi:MAG: MFS transporter [Sphingobium sp.]|nr:MFS transporter [Sphingobium sp.]